MNNLNIWDPVTLVVSSVLGTELLPGKVSGLGVGPRHRHVAVVRGLSVPLEFFPADEGLLWIRGHHPPDGEEGAALLAASALVRS